MGMTGVYSIPTDAAGIHSPNARCCSPPAQYCFRKRDASVRKNGHHQTRGIKRCRALWINNWNWKNVQIDFKYRWPILLALFAPAACPQAANSRQFSIEELRTPPGFEVSVYATVSGGPRHMAFGPNGVLYVAARNNGSVVAVPSKGRVVTAVRGLSGPHSLVFRESDLYVSVNDGVMRLREAITESFVISSQPQRVLAVPAGAGHTTRTVGFGPDSKIYVAIGSSCNFCIEADSRRASILQFDADGSNQQTFASGLRNAVGIAFHPLTGEIWATDNGGDGLGDNEPPEEVNIVTAGGDYGWPDCVANQRAARWGTQARPERCGSTLAPEIEMQAHSAPLGISFYTGDQFPVSFWNDALVAFHGSWNRTAPTGYKVVRVRTAGGRATGVVEDLLWGSSIPFPAPAPAGLCRPSRARTARSTSRMTLPATSIVLSIKGRESIRAASSKWSTTFIASTGFAWQMISRGFRFSAMGSLSKRCMPARIRSTSSCRKRSPAM